MLADKLGLLCLERRAWIQIVADRQVTILLKPVSSGLSLFLFLFLFLVLCLFWFSLLLTSMASLTFRRLEVVVGLAIAF